jgi:hypothetical protein
MVLPNFLIFGVQKAGTTSIYKYLCEHPEVYMSPRKETDYFGREPVASEASIPLTAGGRKQIATWHDYCDLFAGVQNEKAIGEVSPNYLFLHKKAVPQIQAQLPQAKLVAILRDPVERAYSDYLMSIRDWVGNRKPLAEQVIHSADTSHTLLKGRYYDGIKHFLDAFGPEQVKIFLYSDLRKDSDRLMQDLYSFIGVDPTFQANTHKKRQTAQVPKNQQLNQLLRTHNPVRATAATLLKTVMSESQRQKLRSRLIKANSQGKDALPLTQSDRATLETYYREDILRLQDLLDRDLNHWFKVTQAS